MFKINPKEKFRLFKQTKHFCAVPWGHLHVRENGEIYSCSKTDRIMLGHLQENSITEIISNHKRNDLKIQILNDQLTSNCTSCYEAENEGNGEDQYGFVRAEYNKLLSSNDVDYYNINEFVLGSLDLHWSSVCDLKCVTCWSEQSSSIAKEQGLKVRHTPTEYALKLIDWIIVNQLTLKEVYLSGGEPTLIKYNLNLLRKLDKRNDLLIRINSNMMWDQSNQIVQEVLKFPNVIFTCSADDISDRFDYIRRGASWEKFLENVKFLTKFKNVDIRINSVFHVMNAFTITDTIDFFANELNLNNFTINRCLMGHTYLRCRNLPDHLKVIVKEKINTAFTKYQNNLNLAGQFNNCLTELSQLRTENFQPYLNKIDQIAGTNWKQTFKELT